MTQTEFSHVLAAAKQGDPDAIGDLWVGLNERLERFLWIRARDAAPDLASDTWLAAMRTLASFTGDEIQFRAWMFTIARRRAIDWQRRRGRVAFVPDDDADGRPATDDPEHDVIARLGAAEAMALVARLPTAQAEVVTLRVLADLGVDQVASVLGKRPGTVRVLQHRGLRALREVLERSGAGSGVTT